MDCQRPTGTVHLRNKYFLRSNPDNKFPSPLYNAKYDHADSPHNDGMLGVKDLGEIVVQVHRALVEAEELDHSKQGYNHDHENLQVVDI
jgi:hypothetical protein